MSYVKDLFSQVFIKKLSKNKNDFQTHFKLMSNYVM